MKRSHYLLAVVAAALSLSGCDAILETLYPEFKQDSSSGTGGVEVQLTLNNDIRQYTQIGQTGTFESGAVPVQLAFVPFMQFSDSYGPDWGNIQVFTTYRNNVSPDVNTGQINIQHRFEVKTNATYKIVAWLDVDNTGVGGIDPSRPRPGMIVYTDSGNYYLDLRYYNPSQATIQMSGLLTSTSQINWDQLQADPNAGQGTGSNAPFAQIYVDNINPLAGSMVSFYSYDYDNNDGGYIVDREWRIYQGYDATGILVYSFSGAPNFSYYFNQSGPYFATLRVKNNSGIWSSVSSQAINVVAMGSDPAPTADFWLDPTSAFPGDMVYLYNYAYDYTSTGSYQDYSSPNLYILYEVVDSYGSTVTQFQSTSYYDYFYAPGTAGTYTIWQTVFDGSSTTSYSQVFNVVLNTPGSTYDNPIVMNRGDSYWNSVPYSASQYYRIDGPFWYPDQLYFTGLTSDIDIYIYADPWFSTLITDSTITGTADETFSAIQGYSTIYIEIYGYQAGSYNLSTP